MSIGAKVRELRGDRSQESLAFAAGVSVSTLSRIERGLHKPEITTLQRLASALEVDLIELVAAMGADDKPRRPYGKTRRD